MLPKAKIKFLVAFALDETVMAWIEEGNEFHIFPKKDMFVRFEHQATPMVN